MSELQHQSQQQFTPETMPDLYTLNPTEQVGIALDVNQEASGQLTWANGDKTPYFTMGTIRVGGHETYEDFEIAATPDRSDNTQPGAAFLLRKSPEGEITWTILPPDGMTIGRDEARLGELPEAVSRAHALVSWSRETGQLTLQNNEPTNRTTLMRKSNKISGDAKPQAPKAPIVREALMGVSPETGKAEYAGTQVMGAEVQLLLDTADKQAENERATGIVTGQTAQFREAAQRANNQIEQAEHERHA